MFGYVPDGPVTVFVSSQRLTLFWHERDLRWYTRLESGVLVEGDEPVESLSGALSFLQAASEHDAIVPAA